MTKQDDINSTQSLISQELNIQFDTDESGEEVLLDKIAERVLELMDSNVELLFSYLYRLDVSESKVEHAIRNSFAEPAHLAIAKLIYDRQLQRVLTKKSIPQPPIEGWDY